MTTPRLLSHPYTLPLARPITTAAGHFTTRQGVWVEVRDLEHGEFGLGEAATWPGFGSGRLGMESIAARFEAAAADWSVKGGVEGVKEALEGFQGGVEERFALETALLDAVARFEQRPLGALFGVQTPRRSVAVHVLVKDEDDAVEAVADGARHLKVKVGAALLELDDARLGRIRAAVGSAVALRLDANGAWDLETAPVAVERLARHGLEFIEQPVAADDIEALARVRRQTGVKIGADEAVVSTQALEQILELEAADVVVLKPMFVGGALVALEMAAKARACGVSVMLTHALESAVGRLAALHLASAMPEPLLACGLAGRPAGMPEGVAYPAVVEGRMVVPGASGLGVGQEVMAWS